MMNTIRVLQALGPIDLRNIRRDSLLLWMASMPFFFLFIFRLVVPWARDLILARLAFDVAPYYILLVGYAFIIGIPTLFGVVIGFLLLDERDDGTLTALQVTPMPLNAYLAYRVTFPIIISLTLTLLTFPWNGLLYLPLGQLFWVAVVAAPLAPIFALFLAVFAANKVQGFAIMKGSGIFLVAPLIGYFIDSNWQRLFGLIPTYWPLKLYWVFEAGQPYGWLYFIVGLGIQAIYLALFLRRFNHIMRR